MAKYCKFRKDQIKFGRYSNLRVAMWANDDDGLPIVKLTVNAPYIELGESEVIIKNYSENEGVLEDLIEMKVVEPIKEIIVGFETCKVCKVLIPIKN